MSDWHEGAACATDANPEHWFSSSLAEVTRAVQVCRTCPVIFACALAAEDAREQFGVWAAVVRDPAVRGSLVRQQREAVQAAQEAAERQERRRAMHAAQRERLRADPEAYAAYLTKAKERMRRRREQQAAEREQRREAWAPAQGQ